MSFAVSHPFYLALYATVLFTPIALAADTDEIVIDGGEPDIAIEGEEPSLGADIVIDDADQPAGGDSILIDDGAPADDAQVADESAINEHTSRFEIGLDEAHVEWGHFPDSGSPTDNSVYAHLSAVANWQPSSDWEFQLGARVDGYDEDGANDFSTLRGDYGDSFIRYRGDAVKLTLGTQTVVWGRMDEVPLSDRVSTADLTRLLLDDIEYRRRSNPMLRVETFFGAGKLDLVWLYDFRAAELPDRDSAWYPVNRREGRLFGIDPADIAPALVRGTAIHDPEPSGDGGAGMRYTRNHSLADFGVTVARTRQSVPYFRVAGPSALVAEYPRSWALGADAAINAADATWRMEVVYSSDNPVTRSDLRYTTTPAIQWGAGVEFHPGDGDNRINLQLIGNNLIDAPDILDRKQIVSLNGEIDVPFDRERWRASLDFNFGLDEKDRYINPEVAFLGWEPHEIYLAAHYFEGDDQTIGGFYEDQTMIALGWRAKF